MWRVVTSTAARSTPGSSRGTARPGQLDAHRTLPSLRVAASAQLVVGGLGCEVAHPPATVELRVAAGERDLPLDGAERAFLVARVIRGVGLAASHDGQTDITGGTIHQARWTRQKLVGCHVASPNRPSARTVTRFLTKSS